MFDLLLKHHKALPRYTSYPTAPYWEALDSSAYEKALSGRVDKQPLSLYFHIPFCKNLCLFCACSVILNRDEAKEKIYVEYLKKEIDQVVNLIGQGQKVSQVHFGGGTPTKLSLALLTDLWEKISSSFSLEEGAEIAIEIDPRTATEEKLEGLKKLGFNRVSFGVQDLDTTVQKAIRRHQSKAVSQETFFLARALGFQGINCDLIYGLPHQTVKTFQKTVEEIILWRPDRIALFSFAYVPWLKPHQRALKEEMLPTTAEKFALYTHARTAFINAGYCAIGMDHFALPEDDLAISYQNRSLQRNFQGYTVKKAEELISFGVSSIGFTTNCYFQNAKDLPEYYAAIDKGRFPIVRGKLLTDEDRLRKWVIHTLMCQWAVDKKNFQKQFSYDFDAYFSSLKEPLNLFEQDELLINSEDKLQILPLGELFIRNIVSLFDAYLENKTSLFSSSI